MNLAASKKGFGVSVPTFNLHKHKHGALVVFSSLRSFRNLYSFSLSQPADKADANAAEQK